MQNTRQKRIPICVKNLEKRVSLIFRVPHWSKLDTGEPFTIKLSHQLTNEVDIFSISIDKIDHLQATYTSNLPWITGLNLAYFGTPHTSEVPAGFPGTALKFKGCLYAISITYSDGSIGYLGSVPNDADTNIISIPFKNTNVTEEDCAYDETCGSFSDDPCLNGASCEDALEGYDCSGCPGGFHGRNCSLTSQCGEESKTCMGGGFTCVDTETDFECKYLSENKFCFFK